MQMTLAILKPDSVEAGSAGKILALLEGEGFKIRGVRMLRLTDAQAPSRSRSPVFVARKTSLRILGIHGPSRSSASP